MRKLLYILVTSLIVVACAGIGQPDGGAYDMAPPRILGTSPKFGSINTKTNKIVLQFDENIKLDNPMEKVVISPPQINQPTIDATGKRITITLNDSLKPGVTYTIDFSDAIADNNEGNPINDYAFTFSTGETVDTFQVSGYVLNASDLEPIKGILVGLYAVGEEEEDLPDSIFTTKEFERVSRTDAAGHFVIKGLDEAKQYRVFALQDMDQNFMFSQKSEMLGFNRTLFKSSSRPDIRRDTIWHDSIYYDSIISTPFTHFYPDDIVITAFTEEGQNRALLKRERPQLEHFTLYFTAPDSTLPEIEGLNFNADNAFVVESNENKDTITYWIRDSLIYNKDTLQMVLTYNYTDTLNQLVPKSDTLSLWSKISYDKVQKRKQKEWEEYKKEYIKEYKQELRRQRAEGGNQPSGSQEVPPGNAATDGQVLSQQSDSTANDSIDSENGEMTFDFSDDSQPQPAEGVQAEEAQAAQEAGQQPQGRQRGRNRNNERIKDEDIPIPPMPEKYLEIRVSSGNINPDQNIDFTFTEPIDTCYADMFHLIQTIDSVDYEQPFIIRRHPGTSMKYRLYAEWKPDSTYTLKVDTGAIVNIYGTRMAGLKRTISVKGLDKFSQLTVNLVNAEDCAIVSLLNQSGKMVKQQKAEGGKVDFYFIDPGIYYLSLFYDRNGDGKWTTGNYALQQQGEETYFYPGAINLKAQWEINQSWNPTQTPLFKQKPEKITKQKPNKKQSNRDRNAERERENERRNSRRR